jgi:Arc/MetJ-type ribon-helix-helix transcriptional regulator
MPKNKKPKTHDSRVAIRLPSWQREQIRGLIQKKKARFISQVVRQALTEYLQENA